MRREWGTLAAAAVMALGMVGCGNEQSATRVTEIAIAMPGSHNDVDWTRHAREAFETIVERGGLRGLVADGASAAEAPGTLAHLAAQAPQLLIAHEPSYAAAAVRVAKQTGVPVLVWGDRGALEPGLVGDVEVDAAAGGYVAGVLAADAIATKKLAVLIADDGTRWDAENWNRMAAGFAAGAQHVVPDVQIVVERVARATAAVMEARANRLLRAGVQIIFTLGNTSAVGALKAIEATSAEQEYVGVIGDKATADTENVVLTAVLYDFADLFRKAIADVRTGRFGERPYVLTFASGGLRLLQTGRTPLDAYDEALKAQSRIASRAIVVPKRLTALGIGDSRTTAK